MPDPLAAPNTIQEFPNPAAERWYDDDPHSCIFESNGVEPSHTNARYQWAHVVNCPSSRSSPIMASASRSRTGRQVGNERAIRGHRARRLPG